MPAKRPKLSQQAPSPSDEPAQVPRHGSPCEPCRCAVRVSIGTAASDVELARVAATYRGSDERKANTRNVGGCAMARRAGSTSSRVHQESSAYPAPGRLSTCRKQRSWRSESSRSFRREEADRQAKLVVAISEAPDDKGSEHEERARDRTRQTPSPPRGVRSGRCLLRGCGRRTATDRCHPLVARLGRRRGRRTLAPPNHHLGERRVLVAKRRASSSSLSSLPSCGSSARVWCCNAATVTSARGP